MNSTDSRYTQFALAREMMEAPAIAARFDPSRAAEVASVVRSTGRLFMTGEGSSRIFPAKNAIHRARQWGLGLNLATEGARQAALYDLSEFVVFGASNSGSTKELIALFDTLKKAGHENLYGLTAREGTQLAPRCDQTFVLTCGWEEAVAATKSVMEQALFYQSLLAQVAGRTLALKALGEKIDAALTCAIPAEMTQALAAAGTIYFAGYNDGVAEELTLKTNEIARKKSDFLEGTYAVHGIEEVMNPGDVVVAIDPIPAEEAKFKEALVDGVGMKVFAIACRPTAFPTVVVPDAGDLAGMVQLAAGWNLLIETGLALGIDLDKPERARKVGNEFVG